MLPALHCCLECRIPVGWVGSHHGQVCLVPAVFSEEVGKDAGDNRPHDEDEWQAQRLADCSVHDFLSVGDLRVVGHAVWVVLDGTEPAERHLVVDLSCEAGEPLAQPPVALRDVHRTRQDDDGVDDERHHRADGCEGDEADDERPASSPLTLPDGVQLDQVDQRPVPEHDGGDVDARHQGEVVPLGPRDRDVHGNLSPYWYFQFGKQITRVHDMFTKLDFTTLSKVLWEQKYSTTSLYYTILVNRVQ